MGSSTGGGDMLKIGGSRSLLVGSVKYGLGAKSQYREVGNG